VVGTFAFAPLFAVHISDGVLTRGWTAAGFAGLVVLLVVGAWRIHEEEVPRVAILAAAFFIASLIHVPVPGAPPAHLLLNGLLGVVLGPRAALAIPLGLFLQAVFFSHGGLSALGVNSCVMALPALASWLLFAGLCRIPWSRHVWFRAGLVAFSCAAFLLTLVYALALLFTNRLTELTELVTADANRIVLHPLTLAAVAVLSLLAAWLERRLENAPEFPLGLVVGELAVLLTLLGNSAALLLGARADAHVQAFVTCVLHLPLAVIEGVILGFVISFLARVKPEMLRGWCAEAENAAREPEAQPAPSPAPSALHVPLVLLALGCGLLAPAPAQAHALHADYRVDRDHRTVTVESWFSQGDARPRNAEVRVLRSDGSVLVRGKMDARGLYAFRYNRAEPLRVVVDAGGGHVKELNIPAEALPVPEGTDVPTPTIPAGAEAPEPPPPEPTPFAHPDTELPLKDILAGVGFLLGLAAFVMSLRNARELRRLRDERRQC
jgi:cobalt/nickel transport system permease protein